MRVGQGHHHERAAATPPRLFIAVLVATQLAGCSLIVDADAPQCESNADCAARGPRFADAVCESRVCVVSAPPGEHDLACAAPTSSGLPTVNYTFAIQAATSGAAGTATLFRARACQQLDVDCESPVAGPFEVMAGTPYAFPLPQGFSGFFQITGDGVLPALYFLPRPVVADTVGWSPTVISKEVLGQLAAAAGTSLDPASGVVIASIRDCDGTPIEGATVTASEKQVLRYYIVNNLPVLSAMETSAQGAVGFASVPASTIALNGVSRSGQAFAPVSVRVKSGSLSLVEIRP